MTDSQGAAPKANAFRHENSLKCITEYKFY